ncbi:MAG: TlpA disulfide reductase family protein [Planctomycetota bacterium]
MADGTKRGLPSAAEWIGFAALAAVVLLLYRAGGAGQGNAPVEIGLPLPELKVAGWINSDGLGRDELAGRVVVIDCWATWCGPCVASLPTLSAIHQQYGPMGVQFIGLTDETGESMIEAFLSKRDGVDWPIGYGAAPTSMDLGITTIPTLIAYDKSGRVAWSGHNPAELRSVLDRLVLQ